MRNKALGVGQGSIHTLVDSRRHSGQATRETFPGGGRDWVWSPRQPRASFWALASFYLPNTALPERASKRAGSPRAGAGEPRERAGREARGAGVEGVTARKKAGSRTLLLGALGA